MAGQGVAVSVSTPLERVDTFSVQAWPALYDKKELLSCSCFVRAALSGFLRSQVWDTRSAFTPLVPWKRMEGVTEPSPYRPVPWSFNLECQARVSCWVVGMLRG